MLTLALAPLLDALRPIARSAGAAVLDVYRSDFSVRDKTDTSPVTDADEQAEAIILSGLARLTPTVPVVAEEAFAAGRTPAIGAEFWLVDPLDGTREFVARNGEFTINIALVREGQPVLGIVFAPALDCYYAGTFDSGAVLEDASGRRAIHCRPLPAEGVTVVASRSHGDTAALERALSGYRVARRKAAGSSLKFCLIACGQADLYPRFGRTMEWDTAAGQAVLTAAGGAVTDVEGRPLRYGKPGFENPDFIARGDWPCPSSQAG